MFLPLGCVHVALLYLGAKTGLGSSKAGNGLEGLGHFNANTTIITDVEASRNLGWGFSLFELHFGEAGYRSLRSVRATNPAFL